MSLKHSYVYGIGFFFLLSGLTACQNTDPRPIPSVNPFDTSYVAQTDLTAAEKQALLSAKGRMAAPIDAAALKGTIEKAKNALHIFCFWQLGHTESIETAKAVQAATANLDSNQVKVVFITDLKGQSADVLHLFIREHQFTSAVYYLPSGTPLNPFAQLVNPTADIQAYPLVLFVNRAASIHTMAQGRLSSSEILALLQPLL